MKENLFSRVEYLKEWHSNCIHLLLQLQFTVSIKSRDPQNSSEKAEMLIKKAENF